MGTTDFTTALLAFDNSTTSFTWPVNYTASNNILGIPDTWLELDNAKLITTFKLNTTSMGVFEILATFTVIFCSHASNGFYFYKIKGIAVA